MGQLALLVLAWITVSSELGQSTQALTTEPQKRHGVRPEHTAPTKVSLKNYLPPFPYHPQQVTLPPQCRLPAAVMSQSYAFLSRQKSKVLTSFMFSSALKVQAPILNSTGEKVGLKFGKIYTRVIHQSPSVTSRPSVRLHVGHASVL